MTIEFLGTRGNIDVRTRRHYRHTSTLISYRQTRIMIDCGADWLEHVTRVDAQAIVLTHAHPDHVDGLRNGAPCPVYAPSRVWRAIEKWPIRERYRLPLRHAVVIGSIRFEPIPLEHSVIAPTVGFRITAGVATAFYAPDVLQIPHSLTALEGVALYIGDGATITRPIVRTECQRHVRVGHAPILAQLEWCAQADVASAIFTHCGRAIVIGPRDVEAQIAALGRARHVETRIAYDGLRIVIGRS